ncbi:MAG: cysteine desulfurase [Acidobacteria bacterium]|nr:cysteine desulfurase [Acidobacteriota bacterium]
MQRFYFDHNATTPVKAGVLEAMLPCFQEVFGNASSIHHFGQTARQRVEHARRQVARFLNARPEEIVFTAGGTESNNHAIFGAAPDPAAAHIVTTAIEHPAVLSPCAELERRGACVHRVAPTPHGAVPASALVAALRHDTRLVSMMLVNNELGTIQPVAECARAARAAGALVHCDAVQAAGRIPLDVDALEVNLLTISGHKLGAPKGIGALYIRKGTPIAPLLHGGHHERDRRAGTENVPGAVALGAACELAMREPSLAPLRDRLEAGILQSVPDAALNGAAPRVGNTTNIRIPGVEGEAMVIALDLAGFAISSGAACSSGAIEPSHVLTAIGLTREDARSSLRFSLGPENTEAQVDSLIAAVARCAARLRALSPTYHEHVTR